MRFLKKIKQSNTLRWFFLGVGIAAVLALTGMNIYSLYALRESTIEAAKENKKIQLEEFTNQVRNRFYRPFSGMRKLDMQGLEESWNASGDFPYQYKSVLVDAINDSLFTDIHFIPSNVDACHDEDQPIYRFDPDSGLFQIVNEPHNYVCDGFGISKSRIRVMIDDYRWNNKVTFDAHRSMTLALINLNERTVIGHLNFLVDRDYLVDGILRPQIIEQFGDTERSGLVVWLRDWMQDEVLVSSDENYVFNRDAVDIWQRFPELLENWVIHAAFLESPTVAASNASLTRNLIVLGVAVLVLFGAFVFMFINAQRERELAMRQAGFLANITHELKTPLAVMQAAGENISDGRVKDGKRLKNYGNHIYNEAVRLKKMIDKLLDVAKVDSGQTMVKQSPNRLEDLVHSYYSAHKDYVEDRGFTFTYKTEKELPLVMVDPDHIETILGNLVENGIKYSSDEKEITLNVFSKKNGVCFSVADKGNGIPKNAQKNIFDKFYRVENALTAKTKGHGLGLAIVKNMVEMNGGTISVTSEPGKGSEFTVRFPAFLKGDNNAQTHPSSRNIQTKSKVEIEDYV